MRPPKACQPHQAACIWAVYPTTGAHHAGSGRRRAPAAARGRGARRPACPTAPRSAAPARRAPRRTGVSRSVAGSCTPTNRSSLSKRAQRGDVDVAGGHRGPGAEVVRAARARRGARRRSAAGPPGRASAFDPERSGEAEAGRAHPRLAVGGDARLDVVSRRVHVVGRFAVGVQRPAAQVRGPCDARAAGRRARRATGAGARRRRAPRGVSTSDSSLLSRSSKWSDFIVLIEKRSACPPLGGSGTRATSPSYQPRVPGAPLKGPTTSSVIHPP